MEGVKTRGIIFSGEMVNAILAGHKTMTRRVVKPQWKCCHECFKAGVPHNGEEAVFGGGPYLRVPFCDHNDIGGGRMRCPYGTVGDRLWVREAWKPYVKVSRCESGVYYVADGRFAENDEIGRLWTIETANRIRSPIHMPRVASRITLEITAIKVERLHAITEADALAEGVQPAGSPAFGRPATYRKGFEVAWGKMHGEASWSDNPWVWCLSFRRIEPPSAA